jgi:hypothetical protein
MKVHVYNEAFDISISTGQGFGDVLKKIQPFINKMARKYFYLTRYKMMDDLEQDIRVIAIQGIRNYNLSKSKLSTFLQAHIENKLISLVRRFDADKRDAAFISRDELGTDFPSREGSLDRIRSMRSLNNQNTLDDIMSDRFGLYLFKENIDTSIAVSQLIHKYKDSYIIECYCLGQIFFAGRGIEDAAKEVGLSGWALSMRIKKFARLARDLRIKNSDPYIPPSKNYARNIFYRA